MDPRKFRMVIEGAMHERLPCYLDLRHEGNLEGWYSARDYLNAYCKSKYTRSPPVACDSPALTDCLYFQVKHTYSA